MWDIYKSDQYIYDRYHTLFSKKYEEQHEIIKANQEAIINIAAKVNEKLRDEEGLEFSNSEIIILLAIYILGLVVQMFQQMKLFLSREVLPNHYKNLLDKEQEYFDKLSDEAYHVYTNKTKKAETSTSFEDHKLMFSYGNFKGLPEPAIFYVYNSIWVSIFPRYLEVRRGLKVPETVQDALDRFSVGVQSQIFVHPSSFWKLFSHIMLTTLDFLEDTREFFDESILSYSFMNIIEFIKKSKIFYPELTSSFFLLQFWQDSKPGFTLENKIFARAAELDFFQKWSKLYSQGISLNKYIYETQEEKEQFIKLILTAMYSFMMSLGNTKTIFYENDEKKLLIKPFYSRNKAAEYNDLSGFLRNIGEDWYIHKQNDFYCFMDFFSEEVYKKPTPILHRICSEKHIESLFADFLVDRDYHSNVVRYNFSKVLPFWRDSFESFLHSLPYKSTLYKPYKSCYVFTVNNPNVNNIFSSDKIIQNFTEEDFVWTNLWELEYLVNNSRYFGAESHSFFSIALEDFLRSFVYDSEQINVFRAAVPYFTKI